MLDAIRSHLSEFRAVVIVANSNAADLTALRSVLPAETLFIFFNEAYRVLRESFDAPSLLVARSGKRGPSIVRKGQMEKVLGCFAPGALRGVVDLRAFPVDSFVPAEAFRFPTVHFLDLVDHFSERYPAGKSPSSGYAMAAWIASLGLHCDLVLLGFTGQRSEQWKLLNIHAWSFEQLAIRLYEARGDLRLVRPEAAGPTQIEALLRAFPEAREQIGMLGYDVLASRLESTDFFVDRLWSLTRVLRAGRYLLQLFRRR